MAKRDPKYLQLKASDVVSKRSPWIKASRWGDGEVDIWVRESKYGKILCKLDLSKVQAKRLKGVM